MSESEIIKTCADCIHNEICETLWQKNNIPKLFACQCGCFKEKSRYIELPCKVGDKVYRIANDSKTIIEEQIGNAHIEFTIDNGTGIQDVWWLKDYNIGKTVFLTKEEAEEKLRERNTKND